MRVDERTDVDGAEVAGDALAQIARLIGHARDEIVVDRLLDALLLWISSRPKQKRATCFPGGDTARSLSLRESGTDLVHTERLALPRHLDVCEWCCVPKRASDHGRAVGQCPYLEVLSPGRIRSVYPKLRCGDETEAAIEAGIAEQGDQRLAGGISRADDGVHERLTGTLSLTARQDAERSERECVEYADASAGADDVADDLIVALGNHRQGRDPSGIIAKRAQQMRLHRLSINPRPAEGCRSHGVDCGSVLKRLATDDHERLLADGLVPCRLRRSEIGIPLRAPLA